MLAVRPVSGRTRWRHLILCRECQPSRAQRAALDSQLLCGFPHRAVSCVAATASKPLSCVYNEEDERDLCAFKKEGSGEKLLSSRSGGALYRAASRTWDLESPGVST